MIIPGLINTHHHFYQTLTRAHPAAINKELFDWLKALYPVWAKTVNRDSFRLATRLALTELLMSGCTTASDHQYLYPAGIEDAMDIQAEEAEALGMRITLTRGSMDLSQKDGGLPPDSVVQDIDVILADCERVISRYHDASHGSMRQVALAPCSPFSVTTRLMKESAALAERCNCRLHTHLGETIDEENYCIEKFRLPAGGLSRGVRLAATTAPGSRTAFISTTARWRGSAGTASAYAIARHRTWCSPRASAARWNWSARARRSASASTARPRTTIPT